MSDLRCFLGWHKFLPYAGYRWDRTRSLVYQFRCVRCGRVENANLK